MFQKLISCPSIDKKFPFKTHSLRKKPNVGIDENGNINVGMYSPPAFNLVKKFFILCMEQMKYCLGLRRSPLVRLKLTRVIEKLVSYITQND